MVIAERTVLNLGEQPCSPFSLYMQSESIDLVITPDAQWTASFAK